MKLRLFGYAAAYALAGTLCASAQDVPDAKMQSPTADQSSGASSKGQENSSPGRSDEAKGSRDSAGEKGNRSERQGNAEGRGGSHDKQAGDGSSERNKGKSDDKAADTGKDRDRNKADNAKSDNKSDKSAKSNDRAVDKTDKSAKGDDRNAPDRAAESKRDRDATDKGSERDQANRGDVSKGKNVQLSSDKRDRVQSSFRSDLKLKRETKVDVDIRVGAHASRGWAFEPVPTAVIEIVPEYRGYVVAYVQDDYVICDPNTYEIVAVLPASGGGATYASGSGGGSSGKCTSSLSLTEVERTDLLKSVEIRNEAKVSGVTIGWSVPNNIDLLSFPELVLERTSKLSGCRYFVVDDQIAIVDPQEDKVVLLIENH